ncbi:unnamed protein product, partial [Ectocarpus sp. 8 AP-2014]
SELRRGDLLPSPAGCVFAHFGLPPSPGLPAAPVTFPAGETLPAAAAAGSAEAPAAAFLLLGLARAVRPKAVPEDAPPLPPTKPPAADAARRMEFFGLILPAALLLGLPPPAVAATPESGADVPESFLAKSMRSSLTGRRVVA